MTASSVHVSGVTAVRTLAGLSTRRISALAGISCVTLVAVGPERSWAKPAAGACLVAMAAACLFAIVDRAVDVPAPVGSRSVSSRWWVVAPFALSSLVVVFWVTPRGGFARGDIGPPAGAPWTGRVFDAWSWNGGSLGSPNTPVEAPLALLQRALSLLGSPPELVIAVWYFLLFLLASLSMFFLCRALRLSGGSSAVAASVYILNPYVVSTVGPNPAFLAALGAMPLAMSIVVGIGTRTRSTPRTLVLVACSAPLLGYVYLNPPLILSVMAAALLGVAASWALCGPPGAARATRGLLAGVPLIVGCCLYWLVPAVLQIGEVDQEGLASASSWAFTEARSTLPNALWLNTFWGWGFPEYFPFAGRYDAFPAHLVRYLPVGVGFGFIAMARSSWRTRLAGVVGLAVIGFMLLSTGTRSPGNVLFDRLYALPFGWLLREPGRFLNVAAFGTCLLIGLAFEPFVARLSAARSGERGSDATLPGLLVVAALLVTPGLPVLTGQVVEGGVEAPTKTVVPGYWRQMFDVINADFADSTILLLPLNDSYQMPFRWYYGTDSFIARSLGARVISPVDEGYFTASRQLSATTRSLATALRTGDGKGAASLARALGVDLVLVRGDVRADLTHRQIADPARLAGEVRFGGAAREVLSRGPLSLFRVAPPEPEVVRPPFATIDTAAPEVSILQAVGPERRLVTSAPLHGVPHIIQPPPVLTWSRQGDALVAQRSLSRGGPVQLVRAGETVGEVSVGQRTSVGAVDVALIPEADGSVLTWRQRVRSAFSEQDGWSAVGNCHRAADALEAVDGQVVAASSPGAGDVVRLSTGGGLACVQRPLEAMTGRLRLSYTATTVTTAPRSCLWQSSLGRCAPVDGAVTPRPGGAWSAEQVVSVEAGAGPTSLFLYADPSGPGVSSVEYRDLHLTTIGEPLPTAVSAGAGPPSRDLVVSRDGFSPSWRASRGQHVRVDGLRNGWLVRPAEEIGEISYSPARLHRLANLVSLLLLVGCCAWFLLGRRSHRGPPDDPSLLRSLRP